MADIQGALTAPFVATQEIPASPPPGSTTGPIAWVRHNLFSTWYNIVLTVLIAYLAITLIPPFIQWALIDAVWGPATPDQTPQEVVNACRAAAGACWGFVNEKYRLIFFGLYPFGEEWRPIIAMLMLIGLAVASTMRRFWGKRLIVAWVVVIVAAISLMYGAVPLGFFEIPIPGLSLVETRNWGGLPLTLGLSMIGMALAFPLSVLLALGRRSNMPAIRTLCVTYIELIRGVPLITVLFMASVMFPLFLPEGWNFNYLLRAQVAIILFTAAYLAEVVRGGLQAIPKGQFEAADSLGLGYWQKQRMIILPQALRVSIPALVNTFIGSFMDTTLVIMVSLFDLLGAARLGLSDPIWGPFYKEAYLFVALLFFVFCFAMSRYSQRLETYLNRGTRRR
ncbi:amino acid ABC transporter permease [Inquilinus limosus]|uniref:Amino acid ABC transporter permease n=1 Tax=Inquilinus limosus TaxID=171674 RepID=A0A211Z3M6_9PROT|nr:amino acid ABC transporter permease [Inquilinus limosus]OWJ59878.1 amino acid ABC transporter permease [Inquilinus limosus]